MEQSKDLISSKWKRQSGFVFCVCVCEREKERGRKRGRERERERKRERERLFVDVVILRDQVLVSQSFVPDSLWPHGL